MNSFLQEQISSRSANTSQIAEMTNTTKGRYFDDWKEQVARDYQTKLENYADELNTDINKEIAARSEGISVLSNAPVFYQGGKELYGVLPETAQKPFDYVGEQALKGVNAAMDRLGISEENLNTVRNIAGDIREGNLESLAQHIRNTSSRAMQTEGEDSALNTTENGIPISNVEGQGTRVNLLDMEAAGIDTRNVTPQSVLESQEQTDLGNETSAEHELFAPEENIADGTDVGGETAAGVGESAGALVGEETGALVADEALADTGIGAPVAALGAAAIGIGFGLSELFGHHSHHPNKPQAIQSAGMPIQTQYNIGKSILPTSSSISNVASGTSTF